MLIHVLTYSIVPNNTVRQGENARTRISTVSTYQMFETIKNIQQRPAVEYSEVDKVLFTWTTVFLLNSTAC
jgi:hypothetical protein